MPSSSIAVRELPLFPLSDLVLFPGLPLPLHIFEFRYRIMMNTILATDRCFGVLRVNPLNGQIANVGCCAKIMDFQRLSDGRMKMLTLGQQRFQIVDYVREKPYYIGLVEWMEDGQSAKDLEPITQEVKQLLHDVIHLSSKLTDQEIELPVELPSLPVDLSYWVASRFERAPSEQQILLEMQDTGTRLEREKEILATTRNHLAARTALKDALD